MILIIYIIGVILGYISFRIYFKYGMKDYQSEWIDIFLALLFSLLSYVSILITLLAFICIYLENKQFNYKSKPPKWL